MCLPVSIRSNSWCKNTEDDYVDFPREEKAPELLLGTIRPFLPLVQCLADGIAKGRICSWLHISRAELEEQTATVVALLGAGNVGAAILICLTNFWID